MGSGSRAVFRCQKGNWPKALAASATIPSVLEMPSTGKDHRQLVLIARFDDFFIAPRTTRLNDSNDSGIGGGFDGIGNGKNASDARIAPLDRSPALSIAISTLSTRLICPAPNTDQRRVAWPSTIALLFTCRTMSQANIDVVPQVVIGTSDSVAVSH